MRKIIISFLPYCYCCCWTHCCRCYCHGRCSGCCCSSRKQNTMALKDEPSPKCTFPGAETSLLKSYKKLAAATATAAALAAAAAPGSKKPWPYVQNVRFLLLLLLLESLLPLLLPRLLLWLLLQLPAAKHHGPKGRTESKIYVLRSERPF